MISYNDPDGAISRFDRVMRAALHQSVHREEPPARVRESLLRAAAAQRRQPANRRPLKPNRAARTRRWAILSGLWRDSDPALPGDAWRMVEAVYVQMIRMRLVM